METRRKRSGSGEIFTFPSSSTPDEEFEFGCFTPDSPSQDPYRTSPADHLFFNGRLLPHAFPLRPATTSPRGTSRTSSINSKDSLMSSRSNSTNSRSSCSSARTSSSDNSERRLLYHGNKIHPRMVTAQLYGGQYITQVPVLKREVSRRKNSGVKGKDTLRAKKQDDHHHHHHQERGRLGLCLRFFRLILLACRECHAMEPSSKQDAMHGKNLSTSTLG